MSLLTGPLRRRDVRLLLAGSTVSLVGDGIYGVAMAVAVVLDCHPLAPEEQIGSRHESTLVTHVAIDLRLVESVVDDDEPSRCLHG